jgi:hypothetical protein
MVQEGLLLTVTETAAPAIGASLFLFAFLPVPCSTSARQPVFFFKEI